MIHVKIFRFDPNTDSDPYLQDYRIADGFRGTTILDVLEFLQRQDTTLRFRRPGREGAHPVDAININGENRLAHATCIDTVLGAGNTVVLRPLTGMQVLHDLIVEMLNADDSFHIPVPYRTGRTLKSA